MSDTTRPDLIYGEIHSETDVLVYAVQTDYPGFNGDVPKPEKFSSYVWTAFTPKDAPGYKKFFFRDVRYAHLLNRPERLTRPESLVFTTPEAAFEAAEALNSNAVLEHPYEHNTDWAKRDRGIQIKARVIERKLIGHEIVVKRAMTDKDHFMLQVREIAEGRVQAGTPEWSELCDKMAVTLQKVYASGDTL